MTDDVVGRLRNLRSCEPGCNGRCEWCPDDVGREAADEIDRLTAALASERERAEKAERERAEADKKYRETLSLLNDSMAICWGTGMDAIALARRVTELEGALTPTDDLMWILSRPNFACSGLAGCFRAAGATIPYKAEDEQAYVIHQMLECYFESREAWRDLFEARIKGRQRRSEEGERRC